MTSLKQWSASGGIVRVSISLSSCLASPNCAYSTTAPAAIPYRERFRHHESSCT